MVRAGGCLPDVWQGEWWRCYETEPVRWENVKGVMRWAAACADSLEGGRRWRGIGDISDAAGKVTYIANDFL